MGGKRNNGYSGYWYDVLTSFKNQRFLKPDPDKYVTNAMSKSNEASRACVDCSTCGYKLKIVYAYSLMGTGFVRDNTDSIDEIRWKIVKAMLDEFPQLARRVKEYLKA